MQRDPCGANSTYRVFDLDKELHDLCQPLTTLQCRLEFAQVLGDEASLREAVEGGLSECARMFATIASMRSHFIEQRSMNREKP